MKASTLLSIVALLATGQAANHRSQPDNRARHARNVAKLSTEIEKRELAEAMQAMQARVEADIAVGRPRALEEKPLKRSVIKRGASGCRVKGASYTPSGTTTTSATTTTSSATQAAATSPSAVADVQNNYVAQSSSSSSAAQSTPTFYGGSSGSSSGGSTSNGANSGQLTPNGKKAGISAGDALAAMDNHIGWWYNWAPTDEGTSANGVQFVSMLWGGGTADGTDSSRLSAFQSLVATQTPTWIIGPEEPDCASGSGSAGMSISDTATIWNSLMAPKGAEGSLLLSPSMCKQMAEDGWLAQFQTQITRDFDILNLHINKNSMAGVKGDLDYYYNKYKKPIWVTEFACVDDNNGFNPCTDQGQINQFINDIVDLFEADSRVYAYAYSNGYGLGNVWPMWSNGGMSQSGQTYLNAVSKYH